MPEGVNDVPLLPQTCPPQTPLIEILNERWTDAIANGVNEERRRIGLPAELEIVEDRIGTGGGG